MTIFQTIIDNVGDMLGTSRLARLNKTVFLPVVGTSISRREYEMCGDLKDIPTPSKRETSQLSALKDDDRSTVANRLLEIMVENGTVFSDRRIARFAALQQSEPGITRLSMTVRDQMSRQGQEHLEEALHRSALTPYLNMLRM